MACYIEKTEKDILPTVNFEKADITHIRSECIVSTNNPSLTHSSRIANAIKNAAGYSLSDSCSNFTKDGNILHIGDTFISPGGNLYARKVIHVIAPGWKYYDGDEEMCEKDLRKTLIACLMNAHRLKLKSIALPFIGSGISQVPYHICIASCVKTIRALKYLYKYCELEQVVQKIIFVDVDKCVVDKFRIEFEKMNDSINDKHLLNDVETALYCLNDIRTVAQFTKITCSAPTGTSASTSSSSSLWETNKHLQNGDLKNTYDKKLSTGDIYNGYHEDKNQIKLKKHLSQEHIEPISVKKHLRQTHQDGKSSINQISYIKNQFATLSLYETVSFQFTDRQATDIAFNTIIRLTDSCCSSRNQTSIENVTTSIEIPLDIRNEGSYPNIARSVTREIKNTLEENYDTRQPIIITSTFFYEENSVDASMKLLDILLEKCDTIDNLAGEIKIVIPLGQKCLKLVCTKYNLDLKQSSYQIPTFQTDKSAAEPMDVSYLDDSSPEEENDGNCSICTTTFNKSELISLPCCGFCLCSICHGKIQRCPNCYKAFGIYKGNQPDGEMTCSFSTTCVPGDKDSIGSIEIDYRFSDGYQTDDHPNPNHRYKGTNRTAYLPFSEEGLKVLSLLRLAFLRRLTFTIGRSSQTGMENVITWNDIHHKTSRGRGSYGYPDDTYLSRVQQELAAKGVNLNSMTPEEKKLVDKFIHPIKRKAGRRYHDSDSHKF